MTTSVDKQLSLDRHLDITATLLADEPVSIPRSQYDEAVKKLISHWSSLPRPPDAVYQIGQVGVPGISDLDFVLVFSEGAEIDWLQYCPHTFAPKIRYLMTHSPYCCSERAWPYLPAWFPTFDLRHVWGKRFAPPEMAEKLKPGCALGHLIDYLMVKVPSDFLTLAWQSPLRVRTMLAMLHSLKYILQLAEQAGVSIGHLRTPVSEIDSLRRDWFSLGSAQRVALLGSLFREACYTAGELIGIVAQAIYSSTEAPSFDEEGAIGGRHHLNLLRFRHPWRFSDVLQEAAENYARNRRVVWESPMAFVHVLRTYADESPIIADYLGDLPETHAWHGGRWEPGLRYHAKGMTEWGQSAMAIGVPGLNYVALGFPPWPPLWKRAPRLITHIIKGEIRAEVVFSRLTGVVKRLFCVR